MERATPEFHIAPIRAGAGGLCILALLAACGDPDRWSSIVYPHSGDLTEFRTLGDFESLESCRAAVRIWREGLQDPAGSDYECGKNCSGVPMPGAPVLCEATER